MCNDDELRVFQRDKKKSKAKYVRFGDHMYQKIWFLARDVYKLWNGRKEEAFPKLPKNATDGLRAIAERILTDRVTKGPVDIHSVVTDSAQIALSQSSPLFDDLVKLSFLSQREILKWGLRLYSFTDKDLKEPTDDDKIRAVGIMFLEDMRPYIPYIMGKKDQSILSYYRMIQG